MQMPSPPSQTIHQFGPTGDSSTPANTRFEGQLQELGNFKRAMELATGSALPMTLFAAIELGVFDILAKADIKLRPSEIVARLPTTNPDAPRMVDQMLRLLALNGALRCCECEEPSGECSFRLNDAAKYFVRNEDGVSLAPLMALLHNRVFLDSWSHLKNAVLQGGSAFEMAHGMPLYEYPKSEVEFGQVFNSAMFNHTVLVVKTMLKEYDGFQGIKKLVDVGGGVGAALGFIVSKYPSLKGINFDLPHVIKHAPPYPGVEHVGGDMFESVPEADAVMLKWILHDWDDEHCVRLLSNCYNAVPEEGKVIIVEQVLPITGDRRSSSIKKPQIDMLSLTQNLGKERMQHEFFELAERAGFESFAISGLICGYLILEFTK